MSNATATPTRRGIWTAAAALEAIEARDPYTRIRRTDGTAPTCPHVTLAERIADERSGFTRCPDCGAVCGVDRIRNGHPDEIHPRAGEPCPLPTAPRDRRADERLPVYLRRVEAWYRLRAHLRPGDVVWTILRHVSASGMLRRVSVLTIENGEPWHLDYMAAGLLDYRDTSNGEGLPVSGAGMDMGYHLVDGLSRGLYGRGYVLRHRWL